MAKKEYHCSHCGVLVAKLDTEAGNLLRKDMKMLCNNCYNTFKSYEKTLAAQARNSHMKGSNPMEDMFGDIFKGKY